RDDCLKQRRDRECVVDARRNITNTKLERREVWIQANVPPDFLTVVDTAGFDQQVDVTLKVEVRIEVIGNVGARKLLEYFGAIRFQTRVVAHPEGRRRRECQHVRQKIASSIHDVNRTFAIGHADVYVKSKDQERACDCLQFLNEQLIALVVKDLLVLPARDWMR